MVFLVAYATFHCRAGETVQRWRTLKTETYCASQQTDRAYNESPSEGPDMEVRWVGGGSFHKPDAPLQPPTEKCDFRLTENGTNSFKKILFQKKKMCFLNLQKRFVLTGFLFEVGYFNSDLKKKIIHL